MVELKRIESKLSKLEDYLEGLDEKSGCSLEEYRRNKDLQDIVERRFEKAIQACTDIASHIISSEGFREPENYGDNFQILGEEEIISGDLADRMAEMAGFRNVLAHDYADIKNDRVHHHLQNLKRFQRFAESIMGFVKED